MIWLEDEFRFTEAPTDIEEAFVTWHEVALEGNTAVVHGTTHDLLLVIEAPADARFEVEALEEQSKANAKPQILKRLRVAIPAELHTNFRLRMEVK